jgi:predicted nucleic acid-binding protein
MNAGCVVDTNVILRWLLQDHPELSPKATAFWKQVEAGERTAFISDAVLTEAVFVLTRFYAVPRAVVAANLSEIAGLKHTMFHDKPSVFGAVKLYEQRNISLVDALVVMYAAAQNSEIISFDADLKKAAKKLPAQSS